MSKLLMALSPLLKFAGHPDPRPLGRKTLVVGSRHRHCVWPEVRDALNGFLIGWSGYFSYGTRWEVFRGIDYYVYERVRDFLARRHKVPGRGTRRFSYEVIYGERGLLRLERSLRPVTPCASR